MNNPFNSARTHKTADTRFWLFFALWLFGKTGTGCCCCDTHRMRTRALTPSQRTATHTKSHAETHSTPTICKMFCARARLSYYFHATNKYPRIHFMAVVFRVDSVSAAATALHKSGRLAKTVHEKIYVDAAETEMQHGAVRPRELCVQ